MKGIKVTLFVGLVFIPTFADGPKHLGSWGTGAYLDVVTSGNYAFCAAGFAGLDVLDVSDPGAPTRVGHLPITGGAWALDAVEDTLYIAAGEQGVAVVNTHQPLKPVLETTFTVADYALDIKVQDNWAYVADRTSGLTAVNLTTGTSTTLSLPGVVFQLWVDHNRVYLAGGLSGFFVVDQLDSGALRLIAHNTSLTEVHDICIADNTAMVAAGSQGLYRFDLSDPRDPVVLDVLNPELPILGLALSEKRLYATHEKGLDWVEVTSAGMVARTRYQASDVTGIIGGDHLIVAAGVNGLMVFDPDSAQVLGQYDQSGFAMNVTVQGSRAYLADPHSGNLEVLHLDQDGQLTSLETIATNEFGRSNRYLILIAG